MHPELHRLRWLCDNNRLFAWCYGTKKYAKIEKKYNWVYNFPISPNNGKNCFKIQGETFGKENLYVNLTNMLPNECYMTMSRNQRKEQFKNIFLKVRK